MIDFESLEKIDEGKTKIIYANPHDPATVFMYFKDDITAGNGRKHDIIKGKAFLDWKINRDIFEFLNRRGIRTHYISSPQDLVALVKKLDKKINLEVVSRRIAVGSILKWGRIEEGVRFDPPATQFHYKDDGLHDPMLDEGFIHYLEGEKGASEWVAMREINEAVLHRLEQAFAHFGVQLIDLKLEYGLIGGEVHLIDEISGGSLRLWPYRHENPNLAQVNVSGELDPGGRLDKDTYRKGEPFDKVMESFRQIASITEKFKDLRIESNSD